MTGKSKEKIARNPTELWSIEALQGAEYNPRKTIEERLDQVVASLHTLGFVLPLYVTPEGLLLSGHQRLKAAAHLGYTHVPVVVLDLDEKFRKGVNIYFNRATNDLDLSATDAKKAFTTFLERAGEVDRDKFPPVPTDVFPCMDAQKIFLKDYIESTPRSTVGGISGVSTLTNRGVRMPLVLCEGRILNGANRFWSYVHAGYTHAEAVEVPAELSEFAHLVLNLLAMDFDFQASFSDELRSHAFRRVSIQRRMVGLSRPYTYFVFGRALRNFPQNAYMDDPTLERDVGLRPDRSTRAKSKYANRYGHTIVDFGAGTGHDAGVLKAAGFDIMPFEPYAFPDGATRPEPDYARARAQELLDWLVERKSRGIDSIISAYMLNSIPHHKDRMACLCIMAAMSRLHTRVFIGTQPANKMPTNQGHMNMGMEPNMTLGQDVKDFKCQKFFHVEELEKMLGVFWNETHVKVAGGTLYAECGKPKRVPAPMLREALELEFDLPYDDGSRMGLASEAIEAFSTYLGRPLRG